MWFPVYSSEEAVEAALAASSAADCSVLEEVVSSGEEDYGLAGFLLFELGRFPLLGLLLVAGLAG